MVVVLARDTQAAVNQTVVEPWEALTVAQNAATSAAVEGLVVAIKIAMVEAATEQATPEQVATEPAATG